MNLILKVFVLWIINNQVRALTYQHYKSSSGPLVNGFKLNITEINNATSTIISTATSDSVPLQLNGAVISCSGEFVNFSNTLTVHIAGKIHNESCVT